MTIQAVVVMDFEVPDDSPVENLHVEFPQSPVLRTLGKDVEGAVFVQHYTESTEDLE